MLNFDEIDIEHFLISIFCTILILLFFFFPFRSNPYEIEALTSFLHMAFGVGLGSFFSLFFGRRTSMFLSFYIMIVWEIYENIIVPGYLFMFPIDTVLDISVGLIGAYFATGR